MVWEAQPKDSAGDNISIRVVYHSLDHSSDCFYMSHFRIDGEEDIWNCVIFGSSSNNLANWHSRNLDRLFSSTIYPCPSVRDGNSWCEPEGTNAMPIHPSNWVRLPNIFQVRFDR